MNDHLTAILSNLNALEAIARSLSAEGKRSNLKVKADEILRLTEQIQRHAHDLDYRRITAGHVPRLGENLERSEAKYLGKQKEETVPVLIASKAIKAMVPISGADDKE